MLEQEVTIRNESGFHARPAAIFVQTANKFKSAVYLAKDSKKVNGKSVLSLMSLAIPQNTKVKILVDGEDEKQALEELVDLFINNFMEDSGS